MKKYLISIIFAIPFLVNTVYTQKPYNITWSYTNEYKSGDLWSHAFQFKDHVIALSSDGILVCINSDSGVISWKSKTRLKYSEIYTNNSHVLIKNGSKKLAFDLKEGIKSDITDITEYTKIAHSETPVLVNLPTSLVKIQNELQDSKNFLVLLKYEDSLYVGDESKHTLYKVDLHSNSVLWEIPVGPHSSVFSVNCNSVIVADGKVFYTDITEGVLYCIDDRSGVLLYKDTAAILSTICSFKNRSFVWTAADVIFFIRLK